MTRLENALAELASRKEDVDRFHRLMNNAILACPQVAENNGEILVMQSHFSTAVDAAKAQARAGNGHMTDSQFVALLDGCPACTVARNAFLARKKAKARLGHQRSALMRMGTAILNANRMGRLLGGKA